MLGEVRDWANAARHGLTPLALLPRTWGAALLTPRAFLRRALSRQQADGRTDYTPPLFFAAVNAGLAISLGHAIREPDSLEFTRQILIDKFAFSLVALAFGNALLAGVLAVLLRLRKSDLQRVLDLIGYGTAVFVPSVLIGSLAFSEDVQDQVLMSFFSSGPAALARLTPVMWCGIAFMLALGVFWAAFLTIGLEVSTGRTRRAIAGRLALALAFVICLEVGEFSVPCWIRMAEFLRSSVALADIRSGSLKIENRREYQMMETLLRNISSSEFTPTQRYYAQALATMTFVARMEAIRVAIRNAGGSAEAAALNARDLASLAHAGNWPAFEAALRTATGGGEAIPDEDVLHGTPGAAQLRRDAENLLRIRTSTSLSGDYPPPPTSFEIILYVGPTGAYLSMWPRIFSGWPRNQYSIGVVQGSTNRGSIIIVKDTADKNPLHTLLQETSTKGDQGTSPRLGEP